ncbi:double-strand break repair protein AddB [Kordiimonas marina]|uniref:double-strand break repair protein AddB n=1 Tax=Kordiimonas marina TaxID=2872312 RepID=UPI001FF3EDE7|nr:double-strand break repair protein AddB [Kordiimonas marina]MCJ9428315.1 double-strand break repair protein AddB [Kordiimonas marina]
MTRAPQMPAARMPVYTIAATDAFADALATGLIAQADAGATPLVDTTILLPNRRACRTLREAFLRASGNRPMILPVMRPIGDVEDEDISFLGAGFGLDLSGLMPAIHPVRRQALLMRQVERLPLGPGDKPVAPAQAWRLAGELARLMDQVETEGKSFEGLKDLVPTELAAHWDVTLEFLKIVSETWPQILADEGAMNPAARRDRLIRMLAESWQANPPKGRIVAAGSTGSVPATAELLSVIARLPNGAVVLPGLDQGLSDTAWDAISFDDPSAAASSVTHPQAALKALLNVMGVNRHEVQPWTGSEGMQAPAVRARLIRDALLPAQETDSWQAMGYQALPDAELFRGLTTLVAPTRREEADAIAIMMREALETSARTAALITPDRQLARHVQAALGRWGIKVDDSGGTRVLNTMPGRFLGLIATAAGENFAPVPLLALFQHPLTAVGQTREDFLAAVRRFDHFVLRGVRPAGGLDGLLARARLVAKDKKADFSDADLAIIKKACAALAPFEAAFEAKAPLAELLKAHLTAAEALAATDADEGKDLIWKAEDGGALANALSDLIAEADGLLGPVAAEGYAALFAELLAEVTIRPSWGRHPRLNIWSPLEARLQRADLMILGDLNEGTWPMEIKPDPWMNRPMRHAFGLKPLERRIGQSAHDFVLAASAPDVVLTRAEKVDGSPTVPSRWWFRLEALAGRSLPRADRYLAWAESLISAERPAPVKPPAPRPPLAARPKKLSVTQVENWMRDPYGLYAQKVLGLRPLDPVDDKPNAAKKGTLLHEALEIFLSEDGPVTGPAGLTRLLEVGKRVFDTVATQPAVHAFWWPRFVRIAEWFVAHEAKRAETFEVAAVETWAEMALRGTDFTLIAKADRIDRKREDGALTIIDYKTGNVPSSKRVEAGYAPQLPLEGLLAEAGAFEGVAAATVDDMVFWELKGGDPVQKQSRPIKDVPATIAGAEAGLRRLIDAFSDEATPYLSNPRPTITGYGDYDHLARVKEWRNADDPFDEGSSL